MPVPAGPTPKVIVLSRIGVHVALLVDVLGATRSPRWRHTTSSSTRAGDSCASSAPVTAVIVPGPIWWPRAIRSASSRTTRSPALVSLSSPSKREQVAAQEDLAVQVRLERAQHGVLAAGQLGGDFVGELDLRPHPASAARTSPDTRLPSARPSTAAIACFIAMPMSLADAAPLSRTARSTIACSSCSESSAGR